MAGQYFCALQVLQFPVCSAIGGLIDHYTCSRIMNNPLVCLFGRPVGGGFGGAGIGSVYQTGALQAYRIRGEPN